MRPPVLRAVPVALTALALIGASAVLAQREKVDEVRVSAKPATRRAFDPDVFAVRLLLGQGDPDPRNWSGRVSVDRGEGVGLEGGRFHAGDRLTEPDRWEARTDPVPNPTTKNAAS